MKVGDSFFVPIKEVRPHSVQATTYKFVRENKEFRFTTRIIRKEGGTRVWCTQSPNK
jgi:hypothetical protein